MKRRSQTQARKKAARRRRKVEAKRWEAVVREQGLRDAYWVDIPAEIERLKLRERLMRQS